MLWVLLCIHYSGQIGRCYAVNKVFWSVVRMLLFSQVLGVAKVLLCTRSGAEVDCQHDALQSACCGLQLGCCYAVAMMLWVVVKVFLCSCQDVIVRVLPCSCLDVVRCYYAVALMLLLLGCCYAFAKMLWVVARVLLCFHQCGQDVAIQSLRCYGQLKCCYSVTRVLWVVRVLLCTRLSAEVDCLHDTVQ